MVPTGWAVRSGLPSIARRTRGAILGVVVVLVAAMLLSAACGSTHPVGGGPVAVLVVGDSLVAAANADVVGLSPPGTRTATLAGIGASPCDLWAGYRATPTFGGEFLSFRATVRSERPKSVVLAFTGNPGLSAEACVTDATSAYRLSDLVSAYRTALSAMGTYASSMGARVYLSATPARNPGVPEGWVDGSQHGYNGDPAFNSMMSELSRSQGWTYDTGAAAAISGPSLGWTLYLPCQPAAGVGCVDGHEQIRYGGADAIHCDAPGTNGHGAPSEGSLRYARGLLAMPLADQGLRPPDHLRTSPSTVSGRTCST
jgi:hypothetical protein